MFEGLRDTVSLTTFGEEFSRGDLGHRVLHQSPALVLVRKQPPHEIFLAIGSSDREQRTSIGIDVGDRRVDVEKPPVDGVDATVEGCMKEGCVSCAIKQLWIGSSVQERLEDVGMVACCCCHQWCLSSSVSVVHIGHRHLQ